MSKNYGESMAKWEKEHEERAWRMRAELAIENKSCDRAEILSLIEEGVENDYDEALIVKLEKL